MQKTLTTNPNYTELSAVAPSSVLIEAVYECPNCGWNHWLKPQQYLYENFRIVCDCSRVFSPIEPNLSSFQIKKSAGKKPSQNKNINNVSEAIQILISQGFDQNALIKVSSKISTEGTIDEIIQKLINEL